MTSWLGETNYQNAECRFCTWEDDQTESLYIFLKHNILSQLTKEKFLLRAVVRCGKKIKPPPKSSFFTLSHLPSLDNFPRQAQNKMLIKSYKLEFTRIKRPTYPQKRILGLYIKKIKPVISNRGSQLHISF